MTEFFHSWLLSLVGAAVVCAMAVALTPSGRPRRITSLVCGIVMIIALISPLRRFDVSLYSREVQKYRQAGQDIAANGEKINEELSRTIIEQDCEAYILDKAELLDSGAAIDITARWDTQGFWYPYEADIGGALSDSQKKTVAGLLESDLGIPLDRQTWRDANE